MTKEKSPAPPGLARLEDSVAAFIAGGEGDFEDLILSAHRWQRAACPEYGAYCATRPEPSRWPEIPALPLTAFRQFEIRSFPANETVRTFHTSGTTGEGFGRHHFRTLALYRAAALGGWNFAGLPADNVIPLLPTPAEAPCSSLSQMGGWLASGEIPPFSDWPAARRFLENLRSPAVLLGTALAFLDFFEHLDGRCPLPAGSVVVETGGYKGSGRDLPKDQLYARIGEKLSPGRIWNEYGMTELSSQFYTHGIGHAHRGAPWIRAIVIDPETERETADGETGVLRIFDLANLGSCCAIQTRDLAVRRGVDFELIGRDPAALPRGCSRAADEFLRTAKKR